MLGHFVARMYPLRCYAKVDPLCFDGQPVTDWWEDGTFSVKHGGIVCDACYVQVIKHSPSGKGLAPEIDTTIRRLRFAQRKDAA